MTHAIGIERAHVDAAIAGLEKLDAEAFNQDPKTAFGALAEAKFIITTLERQLATAREALEPFAGDKLPGNNREHVEFDRFGLRRAMSPMEIARRDAFFALHPEEHPLAKQALRALTPGVSDAE